MRAMLSLLILALAVSGAPAHGAPPPSDKSAATDPQAKRITGSDAYVPTFGLRASISRGFRIHGVLAIDAGLDVPEAKTRKRVAALKPRLMSDMRDAVLNYASLSYIVGERPDADLIRARLQKAVDGVLGKGEARVALASIMVFEN
ncbi:MAG: hypothetical protein SGJ21_15950 [Alphaproteobacteria bacterium]|nr:hypothetical protein [Alphaproteobacteria bacterium]